MIKNFPSTYLINLEQDHNRRKSSIDQLQTLGITPHVVPAYNGHQKNFPFYEYRHLSRGKWWNKSVFKPGAFACYLSHSKCWKTIASGHAPYSLILEDDITTNNEALEGFNINNLTVPFDIIFVNFGVTRLLNFTSFKDKSLTKNVVSLNKILIDLLINNKLNDNLTPGSYGYIVSKEGATKLLLMMEREKICMGVDYAMIFNTLSNKNIETIKKLKNIPEYLQDYLNNINDKAFYSDRNRVTLNSYIYSPQPLIYHKDEAESSLKHEILTDFNIFNYDRRKQVNSFAKKVLTFSLFKKQ